MSDEADSILVEEVECALTGVTEGLNEDNIAVIIHLEGRIHRLRCLIDLIKKGKIVAVYQGDDKGPYDFKKFLLRKREEVPQGVLEEVEVK